MARDWTNKEVTYLKRYASSKKLDELAQRLETDTETLQAKLDELRLHAKDSPKQRSRLGNEPMLATYEKALKAFHGGKRKEAEKLFAQIVEECDQPELAERARQYAEICRSEAAGRAEAESDDDFLLAVYEKNRGNYDRALEISKRGGRSSKDERFAYLEASIHALRDRLDAAAEALDKAIEMNGENRVHAYHDPDFAPLRKSRDHAGVFRG